MVLCRTEDGVLIDIDSIVARYREHDTDRAGQGAVAALRALTPGWRAALSEGHDPRIIAEEIEQVRARLSRLINELRLPRGPSVEERIAVITTENLVSWYQGSLGTGYDSPGYDNVNGFHVNDIEVELKRRGIPIPRVKI